MEMILLIPSIVDPTYRYASCCYSVISFPIRASSLPGRNYFCDDNVLRNGNEIIPN